MKKALSSILFGLLLLLTIKTTTLSYHSTFSSSVTAKDILPHEDQNRPISLDDHSSSYKLPVASVQKESDINPYQNTERLNYLLNTNFLTLLPFNNRVKNTIRYDNAFSAEDSKIYTLDSRPMVLKDYLMEDDFTKLEIGTVNVDISDPKPLSLMLKLNDEYLNIKKDTQIVIALYHHLTQELIAKDYHIHTLEALNSPTFLFKDQFQRILKDYQNEILNLKIIFQTKDSRIKYLEIPFQLSPI